MKVNLYLMSSKGYLSFQALISSGFSSLINEVCIGQDSNVSNDYSYEIRRLCEDYDITWRYRSNTSNRTSAEYSIAISWRWLIKDIPNLIVLHDSLLPKYRGFAPLVSQLINGETKIGVTAIWAKADYDTGDIIEQSSINIEYPIQICDAIEAIASCYIECLLSILDKIAHNRTIHSIPQDDTLATYSLWRDDEDYWINWYDSAQRIARFIDAVGNPYKGAISFCNDTLVKINKVQLIPDVRIENRHPGKILRIQNDLPVVVCGSGLLIIHDAIDVSNHSTILPLKSFRSRFHTKCKNN